MAEIKAKHIHSIRELDELNPGEIVALSKGDGGIFSMNLAVYFGVNEKGCYEFLQTAGLNNGINVDIIMKKDIIFGDGIVMAKKYEKYGLFDGENSKYMTARNILMKKSFLKRDYLDGDELREYLRSHDLEELLKYRLPGKK